MLISLEVKRERDKVLMLTCTPSDRYSTCTCILYLVQVPDTNEWAKVFIISDCQEDISGLELINVLDT